MANCHKEFKTFDNDLVVKKTKRDSIITSRIALRSRIVKYFQENHPAYKPEFWIQGSQKMGTMIRTKNDECDCDDGVYFFRKPDVTGYTLQTWVKDAVTGASSTPSAHHQKCIRTNYKGDKTNGGYHIDNPVYYKLKEDDDKESPKIAVKDLAKDADWDESDSKEFHNWFMDRKKDKGLQVVRIIKYLKAWCDHKGHKMPNGLSMTVLASDDHDCFVADGDRDDRSLYNTLIRIRTRLDHKWEVIMPTTPFDDLFSNYDDKGMIDRFNTSIDEFIKDAKTALDTKTTKEKACNLWKKHLGNWFPKGEDVKKAKAQELLEKASTIHVNQHFTDKEGKITTKSKNNIKNKDHKFYGK